MWGVEDLHSQHDSIVGLFQSMLPHWLSLLYFVQVLRVAFKSNTHQQQQQKGGVIISISVRK